MTAEELIEKRELYFPSEDGQLRDSVIELMIEFAEFHVRKALEEASKYELSCNCDSWESCRTEIDSETILNAYPLENIK